MKTSKNDFDLNTHSLEQDFLDIAPLFDDIVLNGKLGTPPLNIIENIYAEASRSTLKRRFEHKMRSVLRAAAGIAAVLLVMAGGIQFNSIQESNRRAEVLNQLCIASDTELGIEQSREYSNAALADLLMEMQGFDEETYFEVN